MCLGLGDRAGHRERSRQWRQEQENWEIDVMIEGLDQEVEAQVRRKAGGSGDDDVVMDSDSMLSQLHDSNFEGMRL